MKRKINKLNISILMLVTASILMVIFLPLKKATAIIEERIKEEVVGVVSDKLVVKRINLDPFNPVYVYILNLAEEESNINSFRLFYVFKFSRVGLINWNIDEYRSFKGISKDSINKTIEGLQNFVKHKKNLSSSVSIVDLKSPLKFEKPNVNDIQNMYFQNLDSNTAASIYAKEFLDFRTGSIYIDIQNKFKEPNKVINPTKYFNKHEVLYLVKDDGVHGVILSFNENTKDSPNSKLLEMRVIYKDGFIEEFK